MSKAMMLSLFDMTTNMCKPWARAGWTCHARDVQHKSGNMGVRHGEGSIRRIGGDILKMRTQDWDYSFVAAFPPCTHLAVSGARWFTGKGVRKLAEALDLFGRAIEICEEIGAPYMIENPVSTVSTYYRKPDHMFDPCDFAGYLDDPETDAYTKRTCLWTGNGFVMPDPKPVFPVKGSAMHLLPPSDDRTNLRSVTPMGFANAVFEANQ